MENLPIWRFPENIRNKADVCNIDILHLLTTHSLLLITLLELQEITTDTPSNGQIEKNVDVDVVKSM